MVVEPAVERSLLVADGHTLRMFVASCAERLSPVFGALRAGDTGRNSDVELVVETLESLWDSSVSADSLGNHTKRILMLPELQPTELGIAGVAETYAFYGALALMYATKATSASEPGSAVSCAHACLTAVGQLDQNIGEAFFAEETQRQSDVLDLIRLHADVDALRERDRAIARRRIDAILDRLK